MDNTGWTEDMTGHDPFSYWRELVDAPIGRLSLSQRTILTGIIARELGVRDSTLAFRIATLAPPVSTANEFMALIGAIPHVLALIESHATERPPEGSKWHPDEWVIRRAWATVWDEIRGDDARTAKHTHLSMHIRQKEEDNLMLKRQHDRPSRKIQDLFAERYGDLERDLAEMDEDLRSEKARAIVEGDYGTVAAVNAMTKARPHLEQGQMSPSTYTQVGIVAQLAHEGFSPQEWRAEVYKRHNFDPKWVTILDKAEAEMRKFGLWPWPD